jgi:hypothetical protein
MPQYGPDLKARNSMGAGASLLLTVNAPRCTSIRMGVPSVDLATIDTPFASPVRYLQRLRVHKFPFRERIPVMMMEDFAPLIGIYRRLARIRATSNSS